MSNTLNLQKISLCSWTFNWPNLSHIIPHHVTHQTTCERVKEPDRDCSCLCMGIYLHESSKGCLPRQWSKADWNYDRRLAKNGILIEWKAVILLSVACACHQHMQEEDVYTSPTNCLLSDMDHRLPLDRPQTSFPHIVSTCVLSDGTPVV